MKDYERVLGEVTPDLMAELEALSRAHMHEALDEKLLRFIRSKVGATFKKFLEPNGYGDLMVFEVIIDDTDPSKLCLNADRNFAKYPMDEAEFELKVGRAPEHDDLHRVNCGDVGKVGHYMCGWCLRHMRPRFTCGCLLARI